MLREVSIEAISIQMSDNSQESMVSRSRMRRAKLPKILEEVSEVDSDELEPVD